jgi:hypothetical protein
VSQQLIFYADKINLLCGNINATGKIIETLLDARKEFG